MFHEVAIRLVVLMQLASRSNCDGKPVVAALFVTNGVVG